MAAGGEITDEHMQAMLATSRTYTLVLLRRGPAYDDADLQPLIWEHGRRNFELRAQGVLRLVGPVRDDSDVRGVGVFDAAPDAVARLMEDDPAVRAGIFTVDVHPFTGFPGDGLPAAT